MRILFATVLSFASACGVDVVVGASETADVAASGSTSSEDSFGASSTTTGGVDPSGASTTGSSGDTMTTDPTGAGTTVGILDVGSFPPECEPLGGDCGAGSGCYFVDGRYTCVPEGEGTDDDPCDQPSDCVAGFHCAPEGICVPYCDPDDIGACEGGACIPIDDLERAGICGPPEDCSGDPASVELEGECYPICDPLEQDCPDGDACFPALGTFICAAPGEVGDGQACEFINSCVEGLTCVNGSLLPGSPSPGGCTPYCDVSAPDCAVGLECAPFFPEGEEPPGHEDVGICIEV